MRPDLANMTDEQLKALPVPEWSEDECHIYLWSTIATLGQALDLMGRLEV